MSNHNPDAANYFDIGVRNFNHYLGIGQEVHLAVSITTDYRLNGQSSISSKGKIFFCTPQHPDRKSANQWVWRMFSRG